MRAASLQCCVNIGRWQFSADWVNAGSWAWKYDRYSGASHFAVCINLLRGSIRVQAFR